MVMGRTTSLMISVTIFINIITTGSSTAAEVIPPEDASNVNKTGIKALVNSIIDVMVLCPN